MITAEYEQPCVVIGLICLNHLPSTLLQVLYCQSSSLFTLESHTPVRGSQRPLLSP